MERLLPRPLIEEDLKVKEAQDKSKISTKNAKL